MAKPNVPTPNPAEFVAPPLPPAVAAILAMQPAPQAPNQAAPQPLMAESVPSFDIRAGQVMAPQGYAYGGRVPYYAMGGPVLQAGYAMGGPVLQAGLGPQGPESPQGPSVQQTAARIQQVLMRALQTGTATPQLINTALQMAIATLQNPALYPQLRKMAIQRGHVSERDIPAQFNPTMVQAIISACEAVLRMAGGKGQPSAPPPPAQMPQMAAGGRIPVSASPTNSMTGVKDDVPIRVSGGEYVIPKHIVEAKGTEFFDSMLSKYTEEKK